MLLGDQRVAERVVLVVELDDRARQLLALGDAEPLRERAGGVVAHHDLERDHLDHADQLLAHVQPADEVRRHADGVQPGHEVLGEAVVEHALALDRRLLLRVEGGRLVLEVLDQRVGLGSFVENLRLALVNQPASGHACLRKCAREDRAACPSFPVTRSLYPGRKRSKRPRARRLSDAAGRIGLSAAASRPRQEDCDDDASTTGKRPSRTSSPTTRRCSSRPHARRNKLLGLWAAVAARQDRRRGRRLRHGGGAAPTSSRSATRTSSASSPPISTTAPTRRRSAPRWASSSGGEARSSTRHPAPECAQRGAARAPTSGRACRRTACRVGRALTRAGRPARAPAHASCRRPSAPRCPVEPDRLSSGSPRPARESAASGSRIARRAARPTAEAITSQSPTCAAAARRAVG